jgi:oligopeptide transport system substrate-binding protein
MKKLVVIVMITVLVLGIILPGCENTTVLPSTSTDGQVLRLYASNDPYSLDPAVIGDSNSSVFAYQIYSGLVKLGEDLQPQPDIALNWTIDEDGLVYLFNLREDVYFQDGKLLTAWDVKYSWERACNPDTASTTAATYLGDIVGATEMLNGTADELSGVTVINDYTLQVAIKAPASFFLSKLSYVTAFVVDEDDVTQGSNWWLEPNGTGPFELKAWEKGSFITLKRNDLYYGEVAKLDYVDYYILAGQPLNLYELGEIDVSQISIAHIDKVTDTDGDFFNELIVAPQMSFYYMGFNCAEAPFNDPIIRQAFSLALDKEKLVSLVYKDAVEAAQGILPPGIPGYNQSIEGYGYNPQLALELIESSSYGSVGNLPPIAITVIGWGGLVSSEVEAMVYQWRENLGVEITVRQLEPELFLYNMMEEKDQMYYMGWSADYPHPQNFLEVLFSSSSENNWGEYSNSEVDELLQRAAIETDSAKSLELYSQAETLLVEDAACWPFWFGREYTLVKPYVMEYQENPLGIPDLTRVYIDNG